MTRTPPAAVRLRARLLTGCAFVLLLAAVLAPSALARNIYVTNFAADTVSVIDSQTKLVIGLPIPVGKGPTATAITPDGRTAYVIAQDADSVVALDTRSNQLVGPPIQVGETPAGIAIAPDGKRAYVANLQSASVSVIDTQTNQLVGPPILVGSAPAGIAVAPDGKHLYVSLLNPGSVAVIDTQTNQLVGPPVPVGEFPGAIAITPDGKNVFAVNFLSKSVAVLDTQTNQLAGPPIALPENPQSAAISPDGRRAYVVSAVSGSVSVLDIQTRQLGAPIVGGEGFGAFAISPDGGTGYAASLQTNSVATVDLGTNQLFGPPIPVGAQPSGIAIVPDQGPLASFVAPALRVRPGVPVAFDGAASSDPDGSVAEFAWSFGDGKSGSGASVKHSFAKPGAKRVTLTVTDSEGCSTALVFTGQTAYCNGSAAATVTRTVKVANPGVRLRCPASAKPRGCKFQLQAVTKKRRGKPQSAVAVAKVRPGRSAILTLKPKARFRSKLAKAKQVLVKETASIGGVSRSRFSRLRIVQ